MNLEPICRQCGDPLTDENWYPSYKRIDRYDCKKCESDRNAKWRLENPDKYRAGAIKNLLKQGHIPMGVNRACSSFLGVHIAEDVLQNVFRNVERMPYGNPGYDFICGNGYLIDSKASCERSQDGRHTSWQFRINKNTIADFFVLLAFDDRDNTNPLHVWMLPGHVVNNQISISISESTIDKWDEYRLDINKVIRCCNAMKEGDI